MRVPSADTQLLATSIHIRKGGDPRGAAKKKMTKVTYICRSAKKKVVTYFILFLFLFLFLSIFLKGVFGAFRNKGSSKTRKKKFRKSPSGLITKNAAFFFSVFFFLPSVVLFDFF
jgi:hypothetical protein